MADVAVVVPRKKKGPRVERRGRFTITEIEPDSPAAVALGGTLAFHTAADDGDQGSDTGAEGDGTHHESGEDGDVEGEEHDPGTRRERISPFGSAVFERSTSVAIPVVAVDASGENTVVAVSAVHASGENTVVATGVLVEQVVADRVEELNDDASGDDRRVRSETMDETSSQDNRRVKRKGRFTIIELSSDSPRSRRDSAEEFSTTTSISVTSAQVSQANAQSLSSSPTNSTIFGQNDVNGPTTVSATFARMVSENNTASTRTSRSMVEATRRGRENEPRRANLSGRRSTGRMRSVSPLRDRNANGSSSRHHLSSSYSGTSANMYRRSFDPLLVSTSPQLQPKLSPTNGLSSISLSSSYSSVSGATPTTPSMTPTGSSYMEKRQAPELGANRRHLASRQKAITISAEQFIQQQHTIASLIRQQQDLKQLIGVLAEQQQHLMSMPKQLADFHLDQSQSDAQDDTMREVQLQVGALSRANEALQKLLSEAEQDAHERTMEIECLSNENNELRYRFSHMERRYHEEKKRSMTLEQELQRTRRALYVARHKDKNDPQKQQQKLSNRSSSREIENPIDDQATPSKLLV